MRSRECGKRIAAFVMLLAETLWTWGRGEPAFADDFIAYGRWDDSRVLPER